MRLYTLAMLQHRLCPWGTLDGHPGSLKLAGGEKASSLGTHNSMPMGEYLAIMATTACTQCSACRYSHLPVMVSCMHGAVMPAIR